ncbi:MAG: hypothetical protein ACI8XZ_003957 [Gammaproteobacteria bacterium]|jgi:hypothetical protein
MSNENQRLPLKRALPSNRTYEQVLNHFNVEKRIAGKLRNTRSIEERKPIFESMYKELFAQVPDHPRLTRRNSADATAKSNRDKLRKVKRFIDHNTSFAEFAPGDCRFSFEMCKHVKSVFAIDISDQMGPVDSVPVNFQLSLYDGRDLDLPDEIVDFVFSDQLIEHFHPDDTRSHFKLTHNILKQGGFYAFQTPHKFRGPCDVSMYFCDEPEGFHLKEWTFAEIVELLRDVGYSSWRGYWTAKGITVRLPMTYFYAMETILKLFPPAPRRALSKFALPMLMMVAVK